MNERSLRWLAAAALGLFVLLPAFSMPAAAQDMTAMFREGMTAVNEAVRTPEGKRRDELLDKAIAAFRAMLVNHPELIRVRLELARAFFLKGEDSLAKRHFEHVLAGKPRRASRSTSTVSSPRYAPASAGPSASAWRSRRTATSPPEPTRKPSS